MTLKSTSKIATEVTQRFGEGKDVTMSRDSEEKNMDSTSHSIATGMGPDIASSESRNVFRARVVVIVILALVAAGISIGVYMLTSNAEQTEFEAQWQGNSLKVIDSFEEIVKEKFRALSTLGVSFTSYASGQNLTWPFVTMNDFQQRAASAREVSNALYTQILPIISGENKEKWEEYSVQNKGWLDEARTYQQNIGLQETLGQQLRPLEPVTDDSTLDFSSGIGNKIYSFDLETFLPVASTSPPDYYPIWQQSPVTDRDLVNWNLVEFFSFGPFIKVCAATGDVVIGGFDVFPPGNVSSPNAYTSWVAFLLSFAAEKSVEYLGDPMTSIYLPVFDSYAEDRKQVAVINAVINWKSYFANILSQNVDPVVLVLANSCQGPFTYILEGPNVEFVGAGDFHSSSMEQYAEFVELKDLISESINGFQLNQDVCQYNLTVYPTPDMYNHYNTNNPIYFTLAVCLIFIFTGLMFLVYDRLVERRQHVVMKQASKTSALISSLFPESITKRLLADKSTHYEKKFLSPNKRLQTFLTSDGDEQEIMQAKPIADLFPYTTVIFGDIAGFTSWSSSRDPSHVFLLLETIYSAFDKIAAHHKVFKVETIGDSYVAVTGLPRPQERHALFMARFAWDCLLKFKDLTRELEMTLGPDTTDLGIRFGMHSGPVTAGVLRGEKSRFQLFGDTVNTAARMESTGMAGRIQVSHATAHYLVAHNKEHWLQRREDSVAAKGKGVLETYWLVPRDKVLDDDNPSFWGSSQEENESSMMGTEDARRRDRLVNWIVSMMADRIREIVARNEAIRIQRDPPKDLILPRPTDSICLDETVDIIKLPKFDAKADVRVARTDHTNVHIPQIVEDQLRTCIATISNTYRDNYFHNFEHACHVTMCVDKFLKRIVAPDVDPTMDRSRLASTLHDYTHGINSDPLAVLAILFSALVHDADHRGVSNVQLGKEDEGLAKHYKGKSLAEQNSFDLSWDILMSDNCKDLRAFIFANKAELQRFRQVVVNVVLATDIFDKELNDLRKRRWNRAFSEHSINDLDFRDLRATVVIEHIIQASDVCHTMQHWHIYRKWNESLFFEMCEAHRKGRMANDPSTFWYQGELGFFDNYIIPLAKKLKECSVFGVSSDECLNYAVQNRAEWEERGQAIVQQLIEKVKAWDSSKSDNLHQSSGDMNA